MFKSFQFIRHGETDWDKNLIYQGQNDIPLNEKGMHQAKERASEMPLAGYTEIFTSPLSRAKQTAEIIAETNDHPLRVIEVPELMECKSEESARYILGLRQVQHMPNFEKITSMKESPHDFFKRIDNGLKYVLRCSRDRKPLIVDHGGVCTAICVNLDLNIIETPNCCLIEFFYDGTNYSISEF